MADNNKRYDFLRLHDYTATVPAWMRQADALPDAMTECRQGDEASGLALGRLAYGEVGASASAFAYCWRRFGPPWWGCDPTQDLAAYYLGTPHPEVWLRLTLGAGRLGSALGYAVTQRLHVAWRTQSASCRAKHPAVCQALYDALVELLRPVWLRDVPITILGRAPEPNTMITEGRDDAPVSRYAGYPVPREAMEALVREETTHG